MYECRQLKKKKKKDKLLNETNSLKGGREKGNEIEKENEKYIKYLVHNSVLLFTISNCLLSLFFLFAMVA